jgi:hypothetical protein
MTRLIDTIIEQGADACRTLDVEARDKDFTLLTKGKLADVYPKLKTASRLTFVVPGEARFTIANKKNGNIQWMAGEALQHLKALARRQESGAATQADVPGNAVVMGNKEVLGTAKVPGTMEVLGNKGFANFGMAGAADRRQPVSRNSRAVRLFSGNPLPGTSLEVRRVGEDEFSDGLLRLERNADFRIGQLLETGFPGHNVVIPPDTAVEIEIRELEAQASPARHVLKVHLAEPEAEQLVSLRSHGYYELASASAAAIPDERLLQLLHDNYGAALAYCYTRIRSTDTRGLKKILSAQGPFSDRTDICVLRGEINARSGAHKQAIGEFSAALDGGLPCFTAGLTMLVDRLGFYATPTEEGKKDPLASSIGDLRKRGELIARARRFAHYCNLSQPILQFSGADPTQPDDAPVP